MCIYVIYKATNKVNNKSYIGYTSNLKKRKSDHKKCALSNRYPNNLFHKAIRKYGYDAFEWEVIFESEDKQLTLKIIEPFFIASLSYLGESYNLAKGGEGNTSSRTQKQKLEHSKKMKGRKHSRSHKDNLSKSLMNRVFSEEHKRRISESKKGNKVCVGRVLSEETRKKISNAKKLSNLRKREDNHKHLP
jgi:group I intron endonuclease